MNKLSSPRIAILASGNGSTAEALADAIQRGQVDAKICLVVSSKEDAFILKRVERWNEEFGFGTKTKVINHRTHPGGKQPRGQTKEESDAICHELKENQIDLVVYLGYMRIAGGRLIRKYGFLPGKHTSKYQARSLNSHPGPLPLTADTYGVGASEKVLKEFQAGRIKNSKHTVHVVAAGVDQGPVVAEHDVEILPDDTPETLFERVKMVEKANIASDIYNFWRERNEFLNRN